MRRIGVVGSETDYLVHELNVIHSYLKKIHDTMKKIGELYKPDLKSNNYETPGFPGNLSEKFTEITSALSINTQHFITLSNIENNVLENLKRMCTIREMERKEYSAHSDEVGNKIEDQRNSTIIKDAMNSYGNLMKIRDDIEHMKMKEKEGRSKLIKEFKNYFEIMQKFNIHRYKLEECERIDSKMVDSICERELVSFHQIKDMLLDCLEEINSQYEVITKGIADNRLMEKSKDGFDSDWKYFCERNKIAIRNFANPQFKRISIANKMINDPPVFLDYSIDNIPTAVARLKMDCKSLDGEVDFLAGEVVLVISSIFSNEVLISDIYCIDKRYVSRDVVKVFGEGICYVKKEKVFAAIMNPNREDGKLDIVLIDGRQKTVAPNEIYRL